MVAKSSHCTRASVRPKSVATSERRMGPRQSLSIRGFFEAIFVQSLLFGFKYDGAKQGCLASIVAMPNFRHAHLDRGSDRLAPHLGAFILLGAVIEHLLHAMLRRVAVVH